MAERASRVSEARKKTEATTEFEAVFIAAHQERDVVVLFVSCVCAYANNECLHTTTRPHDPHPHDRTHDPQPNDHTRLNRRAPTYSSPTDSPEERSSRDRLDRRLVSSGVSGKCAENACCRYCGTVVDLCQRIGNLNLALCA